MTDLRTRFRTLDDLSAPNLWYDVEERAMAIRPTTRRPSWVLVVVTLLLALVIGGAALIGSGIVKLPVSVETSPTPSSTAQGSSSASSTPDQTAPAWTATGSMIEAGGWMATLLRDGRVLAAGGGRAGSSAELYDPDSGSWTATGAMIEGRQTATLLTDGRVLVTGGSGSAELYDADAGSWTATGHMIEDQLGHIATLLTDGRVLVTGGYRVDVSGNFVNILDSAELYDPVSGTWTVTANMTGVRIAHSATLLRDGRVLVAGGGSSGDGDGGPLATAELYDPRTGTCTATGSMIEAGSHTAVLLADGRVLVAGGGRGDGASAELYDPSTGSWTATGNLVEGRFGPSATLLLDGRVLVAGGNSNGGLLASAELYDPSSGSWAATPDMAGVRAGHTATLLRDGKVLVAGGSSKDGSDGDSGPLASAELYDPGSGT